MWGDLGALSSSLDAVHADLDGVDVAGAGVAASAMPGSMSARRWVVAMGASAVACAP